MSDLINRQDAIDAMSESLKGVFIEYQEIAEKCINKLPSAEAIPVSWIEERIKNAIKADQTLIARMWQELIDGYRREHERSN